jgi:cell division transport system ATP-binding protein
MSCLDHINKTGTTVLVVTHARDFVNSMKKRVLALKNGELVRDEKEGRYKNEAFEKINLENFALEKINEGED